MFWKIESAERDIEETLNQARAELDSARSWGLNTAAVEAINSVRLGVREGWCLKVNVANDDEVLFLHAMDAFITAMKQLDLHAEPGFFINRKRTSVLNIVPKGLPFRVNIPFDSWPVEYEHRAVIAIAATPKLASAMLDSYAVAVAGRGRFFDRRAWLPHANFREEMVKLATWLGVPKTVIEHRVNNFPQGILMTLENEHQLRGRTDLPDWTSQLFWAWEGGWEDPFNLDNPSASRDQAILSSTILEAGPTWIPDGWSNHT